MDMAKIGQLCVNNGKYNGKRIVSESWITQMLMLHSSTEIKSQKMKYGYLWWIIDADNKIYAAIGDSGNVIYIDAKDANSDSTNDGSTIKFVFDLSDGTNYELVYICIATKKGYLQSETSDFYYFTSSDIIGVWANLSKMRLDF